MSYSHLTCFCFSIFAFHFSSIAQDQSQFDSLHLVVETAKQAQNDTLYFDAMSTLVNSHVAKGQLRKADTLYQEFTEEKIPDDDVERTASYFTNKTRYYGISKRYDEALTSVQKANAANAILNDTSQIIINTFNEGNIYLYQDDLDNALDSYLEALRLAEVVNDIDKQVTLYGNLSSLFKMANEYDKGAQYAVDGINLIVSQDSMNKGLSGLYNNLAINLQNQDTISLDSIISVMYKSNAIDVKYGNKRHIERSLNNIGTFYWKHEVYDSAIVYLKRAEDLAVADSGRSPSVSNLISQAKYYGIIGDNDESVKYFKKAESKENLSNDENASINEGLARVYRKLGNYRHASEYGEVALSLKDSIHENRINDEILEVEAKYRNKIITDSLQYVKLEKQSLLLKTQRFRLGVVSLLLAMLLSLFGLRWLFQAYQSQKIENKNLIFEVGELQAMNAKLEEKINTVRQQEQKSDNQKSVFSVKKSNKVHYLDTNEITYVQAEEEGVRIYTNEGSHWTSVTLKNSIAELPDNNFIQIYRSTVINIDHIEWVNHSSLRLKNGTVLKIGRTYKDRIIKRINGEGE